MTPTDEHFQIAEQNGITKDHVRARLKLGWDIERAINEVPKRRKKKKIVYYMRGRRTNAD